MAILLISAAIAAAIYIHTVLAYYYGFKNWRPLCSCKGTACSPKTQS